MLFKTIPQLCGLLRTRGCITWRLYRGLAPTLALSTNNSSRNWWRVMEIQVSNSHLTFTALLYPLMIKLQISLYSDIYHQNISLWDCIILPLTLLFLYLHRLCVVEASNTSAQQRSHHYSTHHFIFRNFTSRSPQTVQGKLCYKCFPIVLNKFWLKSYLTF